MRQLRRGQVFLPIFLLQLVNVFWSFLIWRILFRMITGTGLADTREEGEEGVVEEPAAVLLEGKATRAKVKKVAREKKDR